MAEEQTRSLRRLVGNHNIRFRVPSDPWPPEHTKTFQDIKTVGDKKFDNYSESVSVRSISEPWTRQIKVRAEYLVKRASRIVGQRRTEADWRFTLENAVLRRFSVEVACPICRGRVWRSEIEVSLDEGDDYARGLERRQKKRQPCQCPPEDHILDLPDMGTNEIFDERAQKIFIYDRSLQEQLPQQAPDRVYGLNTTTNFRQILSRPVASARTRIPQPTVADLMRISPFKLDEDPPLFPFLLLEAKSETSASGFDDIQIQSAFPLQALLKLQDGLQSHQLVPDPYFSPLVWFIAFRGDAWRVYGCYLTSGPPIHYDIMLLWSGSLLLKDDALQLVLIVDYIVDWARDIYRPSILKQLKSIATGKPFDQVSLADSNIYSIAGNIPAWIPQPPTIIEIEDGGPDIESDLEPNGEFMKEPLSHFDFLKLEDIDYCRGSLRSALLSDWRFVSLHLTESHVPDILLSGGQAGADTAQQIVKFIARFDNVLVLSGADLNELETKWTGKATRPNETEDPDEANGEYYVMMEATCYFDSNWFIVRELSLLAVSKRAFQHLVNLYRDLLRGPEVATLPERGRICPSRVLSNCIKCLRSGSPQQVLFSAISCTLLAIYSVPEGNRAGPMHPVRVLGFGYLHDSRVKPFIEKFLKPNFESISKETEIPFKRESRSRTCIISEEMHSRVRCERCSQNSESESTNLGPYFLDMRISPEIVRSLILVISKRGTQYSDDKGFTACVFALNLRTGSEREDEILWVLRHFKSHGFAYHTVQRIRPDAPYEGSITWNLPLPYRPMTGYERRHVSELACDIRGLGILPIPDDLHKDTWNENQMLLYCLRIGYTFLSANYFVTDLVSKSKAQNRLCTLETLRRSVEGPTQGQNERSRWKLKGDEVSQVYLSWKDGEMHLKAYLERHRQYLRG